jgi:hemolysin activation/secretion protein
VAASKFRARAWWCPVADFAVGGLAFFLIISTAAAQSQSRDRSSEPGKADQRFEAPQLRVVQPDPVAPAPAPAARPLPDRRFVLTAVAIEGATVFPLGEFAGLYESYLGREVGPAEIEAILGAITAKYRDGGYVLSRAIAPAQQVALGVLSIRVIEGYVERVTFSGDIAGSRRLLDRYADKIRADRPLQLGVLERYLFLMSDLPGLTVHPDLKEIEEGGGAFELGIRLSHRPVQAFTQFDNRGTRSIGPLQLLAGGSVNSVFNQWERTRVRGFTVPDSTQELRFVELFHDEPIGAEGTRASLTVSRSAIDTERRSDNTPLEGHSTRLSLAGVHPLIRGRTEGLSVGGSFDALNAQSSEFDTRFDDRLRVLRGNAEYSFLDSWGGPTSLWFGASQGLGIMGARESGSTELSRTNGRHDFTKFNGYFNRVQPLFAGIGLDVAASGQYALSQLLSSEEYSLGGGRFGRAYEPAEISGNHGAATSVELFYRYAPGLDFLNSARVYGFYDIGAVWTDMTNRDSLASAGVGVQVELFPKVSGSLEWARPLTRPVAFERDEGSRIFFSLMAVY